MRSVAVGSKGDLAPAPKAPPTWVWVTNFDPNRMQETQVGAARSYKVTSAQVAAGAAWTRKLGTAHTGFLGVPAAPPGADILGLYIEFEGWAAWFQRQNGGLHHETGASVDWSRERIIERAWGAKVAAERLEAEEEDPFYPDGRFWPEG
jgi:hypothetical protein